ncbi:MAG: DUF1694 domain-containing protein [Bacillota bacterium]
MTDDLKDGEVLFREGASPDLEVILNEGMRDAVTKQGERCHYLGELRERVLRVLDLRQAKSQKIYPEILDAIKDPRASHVYIHHAVPVKLGSRYEKPARQRGLNVTYVWDQTFKGSLGIVVASDDAVDVENIAVEEPGE